VKGQRGRLVEPGGEGDSDRENMKKDTGGDVRQRPGKGKALPKEKGAITTGRGRRVVIGEPTRKRTWGKRNAMF